MSGLKTCSQGDAWCGWQASPASANDSDARKACPDPHQTCTRKPLHCIPAFKLWYMQMDTYTNILLHSRWPRVWVHRASGSEEEKEAICEECKSLVFTVIRLEALSCSQTAAGQGGYRQHVCLWFKQDCCEFSFNLASSVDTVQNSQYS